MGLKNIMKKNLFIRRCYEKMLFDKEYRYDRNFFIKHYSHSKENKNKLGYNMLLISHSLEKGMSNKKPRRFGAAKTAELMSMANKYVQYGDFQKDFAFVNSINVLRNYVEFYKRKNWQGTEECKKVAAFLEDYANIEKMNVGSCELMKKDFEEDSKINYEKFLSSRHSVREFMPMVVDAKDIEKAVRVAKLSPSACNRQMCKAYYVVNKTKVRKIIEMAQGFGGFEKETISPIVVTFDVSANYMIGERNQGWFNAGLFSMNLVNALHSQGIGSCFCQFGNCTSDEEELKKILNIPESERIAVIIAVGYYCDRCLIPYSPRKEINDIYKVI